MTEAKARQSLELGMIGNCAINALIDQSASIVWCCLPRFDSDPVFSRLLDNDRERGFFGIELEGMVRSEQAYIPNTAVLVTRLLDESGDGVAITDFAPRFLQFGRMYRPNAILRILCPIGEIARIRIRLDPRFGYGAHAPQITRGSNHIRYVGGDFAMRLTTNAPLTYILDGTTFQIDDEILLFLGPDESLRTPLLQVGREYLEETVSYWRGLSGRLSVPFEWQDAVIRSAITLKLCSFEETGAIIAAPTTSLPEMEGSSRNWDYRYCWLRDAFFSVRALNRLGYIETMEDYIVYLSNIVAGREDGHLQPVFGIGLERRLIEREEPALAGYRGNGPVRVGNQAYEHAQHDGYGSVILAVTQAFFDQRLRRPASMHMFERIERVGEEAYRLYRVPDAGLWEFRTKARVHTHSSAICWAGCDRLARIAAHLDLHERAELWEARADEIKQAIMEQAWNEELNSFTASFGGDDIDASLLLLQEVGFVKGDDPKFVGTLAAVERELKHGNYLFRYVIEDDFGRPENAFIVCTFWYIDALIAVGRRDEARELFRTMLGCRNALGLFSEHIDTRTGELWGNFPQTYSHVGLINCAMKLSRSWDDVV